jgi:hypothetical protein
MEICVSGYIIAGVISFIVLLVGITINYIFKFTESSSSLKLAHEESTRLRGEISSLNNIVNEQKGAAISEDNKSTNPPSLEPDERLDSTEEEILVYLGLNNNSEIYDISSHVNLEENVTNHHLIILQNKNLVFHNSLKDTWNVSPEGHNYLFNHELIS